MRAPSNQALPRGGALVVVSLAVVICVTVGPRSAALGDEPSAAIVRPADVALRWDDVNCFAYSPAQRGYACLDFSAGADAGDPGLRDFETWTPPPGTAWHGHKAVVLVADKTHVFPIAEKAYDQGARVVHSRDARAAVKAATRRGYRRRVSVTRVLPRGAWQRYGKVWLRFDTRMHEGDASYQNHGSLRLSCARPTRRDSGHLVVEDNQAERATLFAAPGADAVAVGFVEVDGGEGAEYYNTEYVRVDVRALCQG